MAVTPDAGGLHCSGSCAAEAAKTQARTSPQPGTFRPQPAFTASLIFMAFWYQYNGSLETLTSSINTSETASLWGRGTTRSFRHRDHAIRRHIPERLPYPGYLQADFRRAPCCACRRDEAFVRGGVRDRDFLRP